MSWTSWFHATGMTSDDRTSQMKRLQKPFATSIAVWFVAQGLMSTFVEHNYLVPVLIAIGAAVLIDLYTAVKSG